jgi:hypothetical protein
MKSVNRLWSMTTRLQDLWRCRCTNDQTGCRARWSRRHISSGTTARRPTPRGCQTRWRKRRALSPSTLPGSRQPSPKRGQRTALSSTCKAMASKVIASRREPRSPAAISFPSPHSANSPGCISRDDPHRAPLPLHNVAAATIFSACSPVTSARRCCSSKKRWSEPVGSRHLCANSPIISATAVQRRRAVYSGAWKPADTSGGCQARTELSKCCGQ